MMSLLFFFLFLSLSSLARGQARPAETLPFRTAVDEAKIELSLNNFFSIKPDRRPARELAFDLFPSEEWSRPGFVETGTTPEHACGGIERLSTHSPAVKGLLTSEDCRLTDGSHVSFYEFEGSAGGTVTIDLASPDIDPVLFLLDSQGNVVATNDDFVGGADSRILFTLPEGGRWVVAANSFAPEQFGGYRLAVTQAVSPEFSACTPTATALCLAGARFQVQVDWTAPPNQSGVGMAVPLTADTGYFWFFSSNNVELVIKVLDARVINGFFWAFYGALSDVQYTIRITDTVTGITKTYFNPQGRLASNADTAAFSGGASNCTYLVSPSSQSFGAGGGTGSVGVTAPSGCTWTASSNASFITITSGGSGSGNGTVSFSVAGNSGAARTGTLTVAGQSVTISQAGSDNSTVLFDAGHHNFHSILTTYARFAQLLRDEGWVVESSNGRFEPALLQRGRILVIVSALALVNVDNWTLPTPSAFAADEIAAVRDWVEGGGALLLITDHMPFPGAVEELAGAFGVRFSNGFAFDTSQLEQPRTCLTENQVQVFRKSDGSLVDHPITSGIDSVGTFTGSAFEVSANSTPLMVFGPTAVSLMPQTAWEFLPSTPRIPVAGWAQGAVLQHGQGRVAIFGEAAMFTEQTCGPGRPMGMNSPAAQQNARFLLNVIRWLARRL